MAVVETGKTCKLILKVATGTSASGGTVYGSRNIGNINPDATSTNLYAWGSALASLQSHALGEIRRQDTSVLVED